MELWTRAATSVAGELDERDVSLAIHLTPVDRDRRRASPFLVTFAQVESVLLLANSQLRHRGPRELSPVVGARGSQRTIRRRPMKEQHYVSHGMELYEVSALAPKLLCADEVPTTCRERARAAWHVESIVAVHLEMMGEKLVGRLLKSSVGARDH